LIEKAELGCIVYSFLFVLFASYFMFIRPLLFGCDVELKKVIILWFAAFYWYVLSRVVKQYVKKENE